MSTEVRFDLPRLGSEIARARVEAGITWTALGRHVGVSPTTIKRFAHADDAEADGVLALVRWLGVAPEAFIENSAVVGHRLPGGPGMIRVDPDVLSTLPSSRAGKRTRTRTTIQRLVVLAQRNRRSVASMTVRSNA